MQFLCNARRFFPTIGVKARYADGKENEKMKRIRNMTAMLLCAAMLFACGIDEKELTTETRGSETTTVLQEVSVTETAATSVWMTRQTQEMKTTDCYPYTRSERKTIEDGDVTYRVIENYLVGAESNEVTVIINSAISQGEDSMVGAYCKEMYLGAMLYNYFETEELHFPLCRELIIGEGYTSMFWSADHIKVPNIKILQLPSTLTDPGLPEQSELVPFAEQALPQVLIPYDAEALGMYGDMPLGKWETEESFNHLQWSAAVCGLYTEWETLMCIEVAEGNKALYDVNGVLYGNNNWDHEYVHMLYDPDLKEMPTVHMICLPRSYPSADGTYTVKDGTQYIHSGAIYCPKTVDRLVLPDSLLYLSPTAIIATAERPLTVVCSRGSVAAAYVEQFGTMYHLTAEYTD